VPVVEREMCPWAIFGCFDDEMLNTPHWTNHLNTSMNTWFTKSKLKATSPYELN
jgi:hypothetical protein